MEDKRANDTPVVRPYFGLTSEEAREARARAWAFILSCHERKKAAHPGGPDDAKERSSELRAKTIIPSE